MADKKKWIKKGELALSKEKEHKIDGKKPSVSAKSMQSKMYGSKDKK